MRRLIIGMTGSTGAIFGVRMLEALKGSEVETHLIISKWAQRTLEHETRYTVEQVRSLASVVHSQGDMGDRTHLLDPLARPLLHRSLPPPAIRTPHT